MKNPLPNLLLPVSLIANGVLATLLFQAKSVVPPARPPLASSPAVMVDEAGFDFSKTGLSDEAWKVPAPELKPPATDPLPSVDGKFDAPTLKDTPPDWKKK
jgi:hypothetical protein